MSPLSTFLKVFSLFSISTGTADVVLGASMIPSFGSHQFLVNSPATAFADSQLRFLGAMWAGWGAMLWWVSDDLETRCAPLAILGSIMVLAGMGRMIGGMRHGFGSKVVFGAAMGEVAVPIGMWLFGGW